MVFRRAEIKKEMRYHFEWSAEPLGEEKIKSFIQLFRDVVMGIPPDEIERGGVSPNDDNVSFGLVPAGFIELLMLKCSEYFTPPELEDIRRFVDSHREPCDVMAVIMRRQLKVEQSAVSSV